MKLIKDCIVDQIFDSIRYFIYNEISRNIRLNVFSGLSEEIFITFNDLTEDIEDEL